MAQSGATPSGRPAAGGDPVPPPDDALTATFHQIRDELVSTLLYVLGNPDDAQDAAQETFVKCWRARHTVGEVQNLRAWIFRVALNAAKDFRRSAWNRRSRPLPDDDLLLPAQAVSAGQALEDQESVDRLRVAIGKLRQEEREVFLLRMNGDLTYEEIAEQRATPVGTVKTQMRAALQKLKKVLNPGAAPGHE